MSSYENQEKHAQNTEKASAPKELPLGFLVSIGIFSMITIGILVTQKDKKMKLLNLLKTKSFLVSLAVIIVWCYYWLYYVKDDQDEHEKYKRATKQAVLGFIIALLAHLELKVAPFWLIWITAYYLDI